MNVILFDFDGVLVDSEPLHFEAWRDALTPYGVNLTREAFLSRFVGLEDREAIRIIAAEQHPPRAFGELWAAFPTKQKLFLERVLTNPMVPEATVKLLEELRFSGLMLGVVSSSSSCEVWPVLERNGIRHLFDIGICSEDVSHKKPDPEPYRKALVMAGVDRALVLEDSQAGIASATAAGCEVLVVNDVSDVSRLVREHLASSGGENAVES